MAALRVLRGKLLTLLENDDDDDGFCPSRKCAMAPSSCMRPNYTRMLLKHRCIEVALSVSSAVRSSLSRLGPAHSTTADPIAIIEPDWNNFSPSGIAEIVFMALHT